MPTSKKSKRERLEALYEDYKVYREAGASHDAALEEFEYLHPITLSRLKKLISEKPPIGQKEPA